MPRNIWNSRQYFKQQFRRNCLKIFNEAGVSINSSDVEACHHLNQPANPKKNDY